MEFHSHWHLQAERLHSVKSDGGQKTNLPVTSVLFQLHIKGCQQVTLIHRQVTIHTSSCQVSAITRVELWGYSCWSSNTRRDASLVQQWEGSVGLMCKFWIPSPPSPCISDALDIPEVHWSHLFLKWIFTVLLCRAAVNKPPAIKAMSQHFNSAHWLLGLFKWSHHLQNMKAAFV